TGRELLEPLAAQVPVLAFGAGAAEELLSGAGAVFGTQDHAFLAELLELLRVDPTLRSRWIGRQQQRVAELDPHNAEHALASSLREAFDGGCPSRPRRNPRSRRRLAVVVQRHGEVGGGAELHADAIARRLAETYDVTLLTTCARDHLTWDNVEAPGPMRLGPNLGRLRFPVRSQRWMRGFNALSRVRFGAPTSRLEETHWL